MLIEAAREQSPEYPWLPDALGSCGTGDWESAAYVGYISRKKPNQLGSEWQFETNVILMPETLGTVVLDILKGDRLGGIEFLNKLK